MITSSSAVPSPAAACVSELVNAERGPEVVATVSPRLSSADDVSATEALRAFAPEQPVSKGNAPEAEHAASSRVASLDGVRGIAILMVMGVHFFSSSTFTTLENPLGPMIGMVIRTGWTGVDVFFVLSGFLITGILLRDRGEPGYFRDFYARRTLRIAPLYYAFLAIVLIATTVLSGLLASLNFVALDVVRDHQWLLWIYGTNIYATFAAEPGAFGPLGHFWSLAVEEHFYLFWPAVVAFVPVRRLPWACVGLIVLANVLRTWFAWQGNTIGAYCFTFCRTDAMAIGALLAWVAMYRPGGLARVRIPLIGAGALGLACVLGVMAWRGGLEYQDPMVLVWGVPFVGILAGAAVGLASLAAPQGPLGRVLGGRFLGFFGKYSYCMYVVHVPIIPFLTRVIDTRNVGFDMTTLSGALMSYTLGLALGVGVTSIIAIVSWHVLEKHMLRLKRYFEHCAPASPRRSARVEPIESGSLVIAPR